MRWSRPAVAVAIWTCALSRPLSAHEGANPDERQFDDDTSLSVPDAKTVLGHTDGFSLLGFRAAAVRLTLQSRETLAPSAVAVLTADLAHSWFEVRPLYWGRSEEFRLSLALGYGGAAAAAYEIGPLLTTDGRGSGVFLHFGGAGEIRASRASTLSRAFAQLPTGYRFRREGFQVEAALLPSYGGIAISRQGDRLLGPFWLRQRFRVRVWHVQLELEHGRTEGSVTAADWRAGLCAAARRPAISSCVVFESFDRESAPEAAYSEVALSLGVGTFWTKVQRDNPGSKIRLLR